MSLRSVLDFLSSGLGLAREVLRLGFIPFSVPFQLAAWPWQPVSIRSGPNAMETFLAKVEEGSIKSLVVRHKV